MRSLSRNWSKVLVLGLVCVILSLAERLLPPILMYVRLGLANVVFLVMIPYFPFRMLFIVMLLKIFIPSLVLGTIGSPGFFLSLSGTIGAFTVMYLLLYKNEVFSKIAVSMVASVVNISLQIIVVSIYLDVNGALLLRVMFFPAVIAGVITGVIAQILTYRLGKIGFYDNQE